MISCLRFKILYQSSMIEEIKIIIYYICVKSILNDVERAGRRKSSWYVSLYRNITIGCDDGGRVSIRWRYIKQNPTRVSDWTTTTALQFRSYANNFRRWSFLAPDRKTRATCVSRFSDPVDRSEIMGANVMFAPVVVTVSGRRGVVKIENIHDITVTEGCNRAWNADWILNNWLISHAETAETSANNLRRE